MSVDNENRLSLYMPAKTNSSFIFNIFLFTLINDDDDRDKVKQKHTRFYFYYDLDTATQCNGIVLKAFSAFFFLNMK